MSSTSRLDARVGRVVAIGAGADYAVAPAVAWPLSPWWLSRLSRLTPLPTRTLMAGALRVLSVTVIVAVSTFVASTLIDGLIDPVRLLIAVAAAVVGFLTVIGSILAPRRDARGIIEIARLTPGQRKPR